MRINIQGLINRLNNLEERINDLLDNLDNLEELEQENIEIEDVQQYFQDDDTFNLSVAIAVLEQADKLDMVLDIIKEKQVDAFIFSHSGDLETYNDMVEDNRKLTQEEYDLLKEVLL